MRRLRVLLDVDGVVANFVESFLREVEAVTGASFSHDDVTQYDLCKALGLSRRDEAAVYDRVGRAGWASRLSLYDGAREGVLALREASDLYFVTAPVWAAPTWAFDRSAWIRRHFGVRHDRVVFTAAKHLVAGDVFVDDKPEAIEAWRREHSRGRAVLWARPWNAGGGWFAERTENWGRVLELAREGAAA